MGIGTSSLQSFRGCFPVQPKLRAVILIGTMIYQGVSWYSAKQTPHKAACSCEVESLVRVAVRWIPEGRTGPYRLDAGHPVEGAPLLSSAATLVAMGIDDSPPSDLPSQVHLQLLRQSGEPKAGKQVLFLCSLALAEEKQEVGFSLLGKFDLEFKF